MHRLGVLNGILRKEEMSQIWTSNHLCSLITKVGPQRRCSFRNSPFHCTSSSTNMESNGPRVVRCFTTESVFIILSRVYGSVTNNNGFWIEWLDLLTPSYTISLNHYQLQQLTINDCLRLAPFWLSFPLLFWFDSVLYYLYSLKADS
jgi:hypothetical protein